MLLLNNMKGDLFIVRMDGFQLRLTEPSLVPNPELTNHLPNTHSYQEVGLPDIFRFLPCCELQQPGELSNHRCGLLSTDLWYCTVCVFGGRWSAFPICTIAWVRFWPSQVQHGHPTCRQYRS